MPSLTDQVLHLHFGPVPVHLCAARVMVGLARKMLQGIH